MIKGGRIKSGRGIYYIQELLGTGRYGQVYSCINEETGSKEAVKICQANSNYIEPMIMKSIKSPYIVQAKEIHVDRDADKIYIFQEVARSDLYAHSVRFRGTIPPDIIKTWIFSISNGLRTLHNQSIVHGDIKSSNVLLFAKSQVRLTDFSISLKLARAQYRHIMYTITHRPPEILMKEDWNLNADVWALGCTVYEMMYGESLFPRQKNDNEKAVLNCILNFVRREDHPSFSKDVLYEKVNYKHSSKYDDIHVLMSEMLVFDKTKRPSIDKILQHQLFSKHVIEITKYVGNRKLKLKPRDVDFLQTELKQISSGVRGTSVHNIIHENSENLFAMVQQKKHNLNSIDALRACISVASKLVGFAVYNPDEKTIIDNEIRVCEMIGYEYIPCS